MSSDSEIKPLELEPGTRNGRSDVVGLGDEEDVFEHIDEDALEGNSTRSGAVFNFVNSIIGAGIIGLPFAVAECGFVLGTVLLMLVAALTYLGTRRSRRRSVVFAPSGR